MPNPWVADAIKILNQNAQRSSDTHLLKLYLPALEDIDLYFKDESTHITGSLKHRLARSLFLYALCNERINQHTPVIEASSGSTAVSEAYLARMLGLRFIAVMAKSTSKTKIKRIEAYGGECVFVDDPSEDRTYAKKLADQMDGYFLDQFTFAARATDWRGNNNIAESIFYQMQQERFPEPSWFVCGAGTGGTSTTVGRFINYKGFQTKLCVVDPTRSVLYDYYHNNDSNLTRAGGSDIEGIGRPYVPESFNPTLVNNMMKVTNEQSYAAMHFLSEVLERKVGASTGTNLYGALQLAKQMQDNNEAGSIVTLICDTGYLYEDTYYNPDWLKDNNYHIQPYIDQLYHYYETGHWREV